MSETAEPDQNAATPVLRIVDANATPEQVAAIVAVFSALGGEAPTPKKPVAAWSSPHRRLRAQHPHGPGGWRASGLPH